jgi:hypothetical protein
VGELSKDVVKSRSILGLGYIIIPIGYWIIQFIETKKTKGHFWSWKESSFHDKDKGGFRWINVCGVILVSLLNLGPSFLVILTFKYTLEAGLN